MSRHQLMAKADEIDAKIATLRSQIPPTDNNSAYRVFLNLMDEQNKLAVAIINELSSATDPRLYSGR